MKKPRVAFSDAAVADILEQSEWYEAQADQNLAQRWAEAVSATALRIAETPEAGPLCRFRAHELSGVRRMAIAGFAKHLIFYLLREDEVFVLRVIHGARDLESLFE